MKILLNGKLQDLQLISEGESLQTILQGLQTANFFGSPLQSTTQSAPVFAVAVNQTFIPKTEYAQKIIQPMDEVEIIFPHPGG